MVTLWYCSQYNGHHAAGARPWRRGAIDALGSRICQRANHRRSR